MFVFVLENFKLHEKYLNFMVYYVRSSQFWCLPCLLCPSLVGIRLYVQYTWISELLRFLCVKQFLLWPFTSCHFFVWFLCGSSSERRRAKCEISCSSLCLEWIKPKWNLWFTCSILISCNWLVVTAMVLFFPSDGYGQFLKKKI